MDGMPPPSRETAERWNRVLHTFRFQFATGGHASDLDRLHACLPFTGGEAGLLDLCRRLQLTLKAIPPGAPRVQPGRSYTLDESRNLPHPIPAYPGYSQPGLTTLFGVPVSIDIRADSLSVMVTGALGFSWDVLEEDFRNARMLEELFVLHGIDLAPA